MRNTFWRFVFLLTAVLAVFPVSVLAQPDLPKGLADRGPLTRIKFIHYRKALAKPSSPGNSKKQNSCFSYLGSGAKWRTEEDYLVNFSGSGLDETAVLDAVTKGESEWEKYGSQNIFGQGRADASAIYSDDFDGQNVLAFGNYPDAGVIAVTSVWGYFSGPPGKRELVEWDMLLNTGSSWQFGDALSDSSKMDLQNITTHELGHSAGMGDLYSLSCDQETMYGYSAEGEIIKRDLNQGDIAGISSLY
ncbi:MAG: hypothetical protein UV73_C0012G0097 [Candidatus Gottesmanbacteria bacterium GW2011_GWA2_43_14]|uniref:Peptidase M10 metallopeptidase domain-containing protein n=1 Tax=Candidatus Gottesmanbacteria bacterium GW2011_GWA2_43_14 TaxID=1618443 RepID=A0A0G1DEL7_9BACT|nr:MAG: hypothetical protein UV73_C0012G0097 [Candidatus Gottesmanbacteria bacterium GW2011_GWA2_43_14]